MDMLSTMEKYINEFNTAASSVLAKNNDYLLGSEFCDYDTTNNITFVVNLNKSFDIADMDLQCYLHYTFIYSPSNIKFEFSSFNQVLDFDKHYKESQLTKNDILYDFTKVYKDWCDIKNTENLDLAIKKLQMLIKINKINEDFE